MRKLNQCSMLLTAHDLSTFEVSYRGFNMQSHSFAKAALSSGLSIATLDLTAPWSSGRETIVFHHGVGSRAESWLGWMPALADRYRLVSFDMRGHGSSTSCPREWWTMDALIADLRSVVETTGNTPVHLVGESVGGTVALAFAAKYPQRLKSLTVCNGAHNGSYVRAVEPWSDIMAQKGMASWSAAMMEQRFHPGALAPIAASWYEKQQACADSTAVLAAAELLLATDLTPVLGNIDLPVLLLHPDASPFIAVSVMAELCELLPNARLKVLPNAKHGMPFSHADECAASLRAFIGGI